MANIKVSALTLLPASSATHTYGVTNAASEGKVPIGGNDGIAYNDSSGVLTGTTVTFGTTTTSGIAPLASPTFTGTVTANADVKIGTVGKGLYVKEGVNATMGTLTLNGATEVTVATTKTTASSRIFLTVQAPGGTPSGIAYISSRVAGTSFGVKSVALDTSTVAWMIVEPA